MADRVRSFGRGEPPGRRIRHERPRAGPRRPVSMIRVARDLVLVLFVLAGAVGGSQVPRFTQEYEQRLGGAQQEAARQLAQFEALAGGQGLGFETYLGRLRGSGDAAVRATGGVVANLRQRLADLDEEVLRLRDAGWLARPVVILLHADPDLLRGAWRTFRFSVSLDPAFGGIGIVLGYAAQLGVAAIARLAWRRARAVSLRR